MLPGQSKIFSSTDAAQDDNNNDGYQPPTELLNSLTPNGIPPHELELKVGAVVMITRNIDEVNGLQNGTRLQIDQMRQFALACTIITEGAFFGKKVTIQRIKFIVKDETTFDFVFTRIQFPVKLAFAITVHRSEGQSLQKVGLYLPDPMFGHGMLYTALSRCTTRKGIKVLLGNNQKPADAPDGFYTSNIVYRNVLD